MRVRSLLALVLSILIAQSAGLIGSFATRPHIDTWYRGLVKPWFTPPDWLFPVVWPVLYLLMGTAAWLIYSSSESGGRPNKADSTSQGAVLLFCHPSRQEALVVYGAQLLLNMTWPFLFFHWQMPGLALVEILVLLGFILITTRLFYRIRPLAGYLMVPYILWVGYATLLNGALWYLN